MHSALPTRTWASTFCNSPNPSQLKGYNSDEIFFSCVLFISAAILSLIVWSLNFPGPEHCFSYTGVNQNSLSLQCLLLNSIFVKSTAGFHVYCPLTNRNDFSISFTWAWNIYQLTTQVLAELLSPPFINPFVSHSVDIRADSVALAQLHSFWEHCNLDNEYTATGKYIMV